MTDACALHRPPRCPKCRWSLAFRAEQVNSDFGFIPTWRAWCWNPRCERDEVRPEEALVTYRAKLTP